MSAPVVEVKSNSKSTHPDCPTKTESENVKSSPASVYVTALGDISVIESGLLLIMPAT